MAKRQTRRSISVRGTTYEALRAHCAEVALSMSDFIEQRIAEYFANHSGVAVAASPAVKPEATAQKQVESQKAKAKPASAKPVTAKVVAAKAESKKAKAEPARIPAASAIHKPAALAARRSSAPATVAEPVEPAGSIGRPGPTPADQVIKPRPVYDETNDYRGIRF